MTVRELEHYVAFRRLKNFACVKVLQGDLQIWLKLDPASVELQQGFTRDVSDIGHQGTGNLEVQIQTVAGLEKGKTVVVPELPGKLSRLQHLGPAAQPLCNREIGRCLFEYESRSVAIRNGMADVG